MAIKRRVAATAAAVLLVAACGASEASETSGAVGTPDPAPQTPTSATLAEPDSAQSVDLERDVDAAAVLGLIRENASCPQDERDLLAEPEVVFRVIEAWHTVTGVSETQALPVDEERVSMMLRTDDGTEVEVATTARAIGDIQQALRTPELTLTVGSVSRSGSTPRASLVAVFGSDGLAFAGTCTTDSLLVPLERRHEDPVAVFEAAIGLTGDELVAALLGSEPDTGDAEEPTPETPTQIIPGLDQEPGNDLVATTLLVDWSASAFPDGAAICVRTSAGWGDCLSIGSAYDGYARDVTGYGPPGEPVEVVYTEDNFLRDVTPLRLDPPILAGQELRMFRVAVPSMADLTAATVVPFDCGVVDPVMYIPEPCADDIKR